jgi:hypothetical protein
MGVRGISEKRFGWGPPHPAIFHQVFILKLVKVLCFDTLLEVFILKDLECTKIVQSGSVLRVLLPRGFGAEASEGGQRRMD